MVTDVDGNKLESREATFATALPDGTYASWQGAQWIGSQLFEQEKYASWLYPVKN